VCRDAADDCDYVEYCVSGVCPEDLTNTTCVAANAETTESDSASFPMYAVAIIAIGTVLFVVVIVFVVYRIRKTGDEFHDLDGEAQAAVSTESSAARQEYLDNQNTLPSSYKPVSRAANHRISLKRPISVRLAAAPFQSGRPEPPPRGNRPLPQAHNGYNNGYNNNNTAAPQTQQKLSVGPAGQLPPVPIAQRYSQAQQQQAQQRPPLPQRGNRLSIKARPLSTKMAPMRLPQPSPLEGGKAVNGSRPLPQPGGRTRPVPPKW
jgi:hypothetical protein